MIAFFRNICKIYTACPELKRYLGNPVLLRPRRTSFVLRLVEIRAKQFQVCSKVFPNFNFF